MDRRGRRGQGNRGGPRKNSASMGRGHQSNNEEQRARQQEHRQPYVRSQQFQHRPSQQGHEPYPGPSGNFAGSHGENFACDQQFPVLGSGRGRRHRVWQERLPYSDQASNNEGQLVTDVSHLKISPPAAEVKGNGRIYHIPEKKNIATRCKRTTRIEVNYLPITLKNTKSVIHYDCSFEPNKISKKLLRAAMEKMRVKHYSNRNATFDGKKNLFSNEDKLIFSGEELTDTVELIREGREDGLKIQVTIKQVAIEDMSKITKFFTDCINEPQTACQILDVVLRNPSLMRNIQVGRNFYTPPARPEMTYQLGNGFELWYGFYQSTVLGSSQPYLNVDVAHKGFPEPKNLIDVILEIKGRRVPREGRKPTSEQLNKGLLKNEAEDFEKHIKGLRVKYEIPYKANSRREYRVNGIKDSCRNHSFVPESGNRITVEEYFRREKNYTLKFPELPCIHVGNPHKDICLPPELCTIIPGQFVTRKMDKFQTAKLIKAAAKPPIERKRRIMEAITNTNYNEDPCVKEFGVSVENKFLEVPARILNSPKLVYKNKEVDVHNGQWRAQQFLQSRPLERWIIISVSSDVGQGLLRNLTEKIMDLGPSNGMAIKEPLRCDILSQGRSGGLTRLNLQEYFDHYKEMNVQLVVVVIPEWQNNAYNIVKGVAEMEVGLLTQCIKDKTVKQRLDNATVGNILLKINAKLNGTNHTFLGRTCPKTVARLCEGVMIMGADVTHPSRDERNIPSVAAVTASHDRQAFQYNMCWSLQPPKQEIITNLQGFVRKQIQFYKKKNGAPPKMIIFYRDGVSDGQFNQVLEEELSAIKSACMEELKQLIQVIFLVVQKRHHTRFFPINQEDMDRIGNVPPGTVVNTDITHPREAEFYMVSHASLQGTSRPTKYHKLWDDRVDGDEDDLEELTYYLCHQFSRCTRSVSYPAPTYYAHLAAARGRVYLEGSSIDIENLSEEMMKRTIHEAVVDGSPMFYI